MSNNTTDKIRIQKVNPAGNPKDWLEEAAKHPGRWKELHEYLMPALATFGYTNAKFAFTDDDDPMLEIEGGLWIAWGDIYVTRQRLDGETKKTEPGWTWGVIHHNPGVRYYSDGSGEPPSDEPVEKGTFLAGQEGRLAYAAVNELLSRRLSAVIENINENKMAEEFARYDAAVAAELRM